MMISSVGTTGMSAAYLQRPPAPPKPEEKFKELDTDGSGSLNTDELQTMAEELSEMTGVTLSVEDLLEKLDADGNGTLEVGEMPERKQGEFRGPPPFMAADGSVQDGASATTFNAQDSLLAYLSAAQEEEDSFSALDYQA